MVFRSLLCFAWLLAVLAALPLHGQSVDERFLDGLRQRRLFALAETYCLDKLSDSSLTDARRAELVVELSRTYSQHALHSTPSAAEPLWKQAVEVTYDFARRLPESPWIVLVKTQSGLALVTRGEAARQQSEVAANNAPLLTEARNYLRLGLRQLTDVNSELAERLRPSPRGGKQEGPTRDQLLALDRHVRFHRAHALRIQGESYPPDSADRSNSLLQAVELLTPLAQLSTAEPLGFQCRLEEVICRRLLKDHATALRRLDTLAGQESLPADIALASRAERIRLSLAMDRIDAALALAESTESEPAVASPELDLAIFEAHVAAWRDAERRQQIAEARNQQSHAVGAIAEIQQRHGVYWQRRAEMLLAAAAANSAAAPSDLEVLIKTAQSHYRGGDFDAAVAAYDQAAQLATQRQAAGQAFELAYTAASIEQQRKAHRSAADRFRQLATSTPNHPQAGDAHLLAIFNAAQVARQQEPQRLDEYAALIDEHLRLWPEEKSSEQAHWLLGRLRQHQGKHEEAIVAYSRVSADHPQFAAAIQGIAQCYTTLIQELNNRGEATQELSLAAARYFENLFITADGRLPEIWSPSQQLAALVAARTWLDADEPDPVRAQRILAAALSNSGDAPESWKGSATVVLASALAAQRRYQEAGEQLHGGPAGSPAELLAFLQPLSEAARRETSDQARSQIAQLQLAVLELLEPRRQELDLRSQAALERYQAQALGMAGKQAEAIGRYQELARRYPDDGQIQEEFALLLTDKGDKAALEQSLAIWREIEQRSPPASQRWFRAKYHLALVHERLGNKAHAAKLITLTQVLHPELGGPEWKAKFLELLARCK